MILNQTTFNIIVRKLEESKKIHFFTSTTIAPLFGAATNSSSERPFIDIYII